jgi:hypothetical protein
MTLRLMGRYEAWRGGFRLDQLAKAFDRVRNERDWKAPIQAEIAAADRLVVEQAIIWFTRTVPLITPVPERPDRLMVTAAGYERGPWGNACTAANRGSVLERRQVG